ncbi:MAG: type VI secretion system tube protein TssD [Mucilaginibacter sp.]
MKTLFSLTITCLLCFVLVKASYGQSDENRTKIQMTIKYEGKNIVTDLNGVSTSLSRVSDELPAIPAVKDSLKNKIPGYTTGNLYLMVDAKKVSDDLLRVFAKKQNKFDGTITIVDNFGKNPPRTIQFKQASLYSYSDQVSAGGYSESYGATSISFSCKELTINDISIEQ